MLLIAYHFPPDSAIGGARPYRIYRNLPNFGYSRHVVTAVEESQGMPDVHVVPDTLGKLWERKNARLTPAAHAERLVRKLILPGEAGVGWSVSAARKTREILHRQQASSKLTVFSTFPPVGTHLAALQAVRGTGAKLIADYRDPFSITRPWSTGLAKKGVDALDRAFLRRADLILANTDQAKDAFVRTYPWTTEKIRVLHNGFDPEDAPVAAPIAARPFRTLVHAGTLYVGRNPDLLLQSLSRLRQSRPELASPVRVDLVGSRGYRSECDEALLERAQSEGWVSLTSQVPRAEAQRLMCESDGLLLLQQEFKMQIPGKLFEYVTIGRPILAIVPRDSSVEWVLTRAGVPYVCLHPDDPPAETDAKMAQYLAMPSTPQTPSEWFRDRFSAPNQVRQLLDWVEELHGGIAETTAAVGPSGREGSA